MVSSNCTFVSQVYSLIGGFCASAVNFHAKDGSGYKFLADIVLELDKLNPQVCSYDICHIHSEHYVLEASVLFSVISGLLLWFLLSVKQYVMHIL